MCSEDTKQEKEGKTSNQTHDGEILRIAKLKTANT
jgi:hypothetical protein